MRQWRVIYDTKMTGIRNMAVDEAILGAVAQGKSPPTLRLYRWQPMCLSLGYAQRSSDVDFERVEKNRWQVVRRRTGGRAILHGDELTYSVTLPINHPISEGGIVQSYRRISQALLRALETLDISTQALPHEKVAGSNQDPICFDVPSNYEITANDRKLIGSAQYRQKYGVLQHGTLPICSDITRICEALYYPTELERANAKEKVRQRATTLEAISGKQFSWEVVAKAVQRGFSEQFDIVFEQSHLTDLEENEAQRLADEVYGTEVWTRRRR